MQERSVQCGEAPDEVRRRKFSSAGPWAADMVATRKVVCLYRRIRVPLIVFTEPQLA